MNMEDLKFLREMVVKSETEDFSDEQLQRIGNALRTNVNADDTTEALDLTAQIIYDQSMYTDKLGRKREVDVEKLDSLARDVIDKGFYLGATSAIDYAKDVRFFVAQKQAEKGTIAKEDVNLMDSNYNNSVLGSMLYEAKSPLAVKALIDKGANKLGAEDDFENIKDMLIRRVTSEYEFEHKDYGENRVKNNLGNLAVLIKTGLIEKPKDLDRLLTNPELFEKYPDVMNKLFEGDKELPNKLEKIKNRENLKEQKDDYLKEKLTAVRNAIRNNSIFKIRKDGKAVRKQRPDYEVMGTTGDSVSKENNELHKKHYKEVADIQKDAAKEIMKQHRENADRQY